MTNQEKQICQNCKSEGNKNCYLVIGAEDSRYIWLSSQGIKDSYDCDHCGLKSERSYEVSTLYPGNNCFFSKNILSCYNVHKVIGK